MKKHAHLLISGRVQGVWFRESVRMNAVRMNIAGFVRNLPDGQVEAVFEGNEDDVDALITYCRRGPEYAVVAGVEVATEPFVGNFMGFEVRY